MADEIRKLQLRAAACTDELLDISNDIGNEVLPLYTQTDRSMFDLQCRLQMSRCKHVIGQLEEIRDALEKAAAPEQTPTAAGRAEDPGRAVPEAFADTADDTPDARAAQERRTSARITLQIIAQNLAIAEQKRILLQDLLISSGQAAVNRKAAEKLQDSAEIAQLRQTLRDALK